MTEDRAIHLSRLYMHLPSKHTDSIFIFRVASNSALMDTGTKNSLIFILIPKNPLSCRTLYWTLVLDNVALHQKI